MANFQTHLSVAAGVSGVVAVNLMLTGAVPPGQVMTYFLIGTLGGLAPDVDLAHSTSFRIVAQALGVLAGFTLVLNAPASYSLVELLILWGLAYAAVRFGLFPLLARSTYHRGIVHSIPAALFAGLLTVVLTHRLGQVAPLHAWLCGFFMTLGFIVHLVLDELYSVDLYNRRIKRSSGTALHFIEPKQPLATAYLYGSLVVLFFMAPSSAAFVNRVIFLDVARWVTQLWPDGPWFRGLGFN